MNLTAPVARYQILPFTLCRVLELRYSWRGSAEVDLQVEMFSVDRCRGNLSTSVVTHGGPPPEVALAQRSVY